MYVVSTSNSTWLPTLIEDISLAAIDTLVGAESKAYVLSVVPVAAFFNVPLTAVTVYVAGVPKSDCFFNGRIRPLVLLI